MVVGSWLGKLTVERLSVKKFRVRVGRLLIVMALQTTAFG
jgi:uncharacterized membrane protein YfcA